MNSNVYKSLVNLCVDICKRNGKRKLLWLGDKNKTLNYIPKSDEMVLTVHRWFANKACPGDWLYTRLGNLAAEVTQRLSEGGITSGGVIVRPTKKTLYRVRRSWSDAKSQIGAYSVLENAKAKADANPGYKVFDDEGNVVWEKDKPTAFKPYKVQVTTSALNIRKGAGTNYAVSGSIRDKGVYTIVAEKDGWGKLKSGAGWISLAYTKKL